MFFVRSKFKCLDGRTFARVLSRPNNTPMRSFSHKIQKQQKFGDRLRRPHRRQRRHAIVDDDDVGDVAAEDNMYRF